jgi:hypothetical protein
MPHRLTEVGLPPFGGQHWPHGPGRFSYAASSIDRFDFLE